MVDVRPGRLPPLASLEAFLATAEEGSVKAAAARLALSAPALSRRIKTLEEAVGAPLFDRHHRGLRLTAGGRALSRAVGPLIEEIRHAIAGAATGEGSLRMTLNVMPLFAQQRLFPRLPELRARHPDLHLDIETLAHGETRLADSADAAIALARLVDPLLHSVRLGVDQVFAIGSARVQAGPDAVRRVDDLRRCRVLVHSAMPETFTEWCAAIGRPDLAAAAIDMFDSGPLMLEAAAQGVGVAFMHGHHIDDAHDDRLARVFDQAVDSPYSYWFVCRPRALRQPAVRLFHDWLVEAGI